MSIERIHMNKINEYEHKVQYYETDQMGIVHHSNYIRWFEEARSYFLEEVGFGYAKIEHLGIIIPVLAVSAEYKSMTHFADVVCIRPKMYIFNGIKMALTYEVTDKNTGELRCSGSTRHCFLDREGKLISLKRSFPEVYQVFQKMLI